MSAVRGIAKKDFYIAKFIATVPSEYGRPIRSYELPILVSHNVQPISDKLDFSMYGERVSRMYRGVLPNTQENRDLYTEGSVAYFDGRTPVGEVSHGDNGNYFVVGSRVYNQSLHIYFEKIGSENR